MRILVTGANGSIGQKLVPMISRLNYEMTLFLRPGKNTLESFGQIVYGDLSNEESLKAAVLGAETVIHLAGLTQTNDLTLYNQVNVLGTKNLLLASRQSRVKRFIFISSRSASLTSGGYARSKFLAEEEVRKSNLNWVILRLAEVYGASDNEAIGKLIKIIKSSFIIPVIGRGQYKVSPIFINDAVSGIVAVLNKPAINGKIYNLAGPEEFTFSELLSRVLKEMKLKRIIIFIPVVAVKITLAVFSWLKLNLFFKDQLPRLLSAKSADISQALKDFNFQPRSFDNGLKEILKQDYWP